MSEETIRLYLAAVLQCSGEAFLGIGSSGLIEHWNRAAEELYGYSASEVLGRSPSCLAPEGRRDEWDGLWTRIVRGEVVADFETTRRRKDGSLVNVCLTVSPLRASSGAMVGCSKIVRNLSNRVRAERSLKTLLESTPDGMIGVDRMGKIRLVNREAERLFGYERDELIGNSVDVLLPADLREKHERHRLAFNGSPRHRRVSAAKPLEARRKDGSVFDSEITLSPIEGGPDGIVVVAAIRDVTEHSKMRDQLILLDRMVSMGTLAAGIAHEINNPLTAITTNLDLALADIADPAKRATVFDYLEEELRDAREAAERVHQIVRDVRLFSHSDNDNLEAVDIGPVMESSLRIAWSEIRRRARLVKDYRTVPRVRASASRLGQVFLNILVNAAQAIPEGHTESNEIRIGTGPDAEGQVVVTIADTGAGMPPHVLKHLFTPFFTTKPPGVGTGLGLAICHRLVTQFGGRISVESTIGRGSIFRIALCPAGGADGAH